MKSILTSQTFVIIIYSILTFVLVCAAFKIGKDIGYSNGTISSCSAEYINGANDGLDICLDSILDGLKNRNNYIPTPHKDETL